MEIDTRTSGFELTAALAQRVDRRVRSALGAVAARTTRVTPVLVRP